MAGTDHKSRLRIASCAEEVSPGTFNDAVTGGCLDPANAALQVYVAQTNFETNNDVFDREIAAKTFAREPGLISRKTGTITVQAEARGAGGTVTSVVSFDLWLKACGMDRGTAEAFEVSSAGAHANLDQAYAGMTLTQQTSPLPSPVVTAKLIYIDPWLDTKSGVTDNCIVYAVTGTPDPDDPWEGVGLDGSTVTIEPNGDAPAPYGNVYYFNTNKAERYSSCLWNPYSATNATRQKIEGAVGNCSISAGNVGEPVFLNFSLQGRIPSSDGQDDATIPTSIPYETTTPPTFSGVDARIHNRTMATASPPDDSDDWPSDVCFNTMDIDFGNDIQLDECATATGGVKKVDINGRAPTGNINPRLWEESVISFFDEWDLQDDMIMKMVIGSTLGNIVELFIPKARFNTYGLGDVNGNTVVPFPFGLYTPKADPGDNDFYLITR